MPPKPSRDGQCYPHRFKFAWKDDVLGGLIFCQWCGEIRELEAQRVGPPAEETITITDKQVGGSF